MQPPPVPTGLPEPEPTALNHSQFVLQYLLERMADSGGALSFGEFMHYALYAPGLGYYVSGAPKFSADGDFVTAPELSPLFGRVVADQLVGVLADCSSASLLEIGAGTGRLAAQLLTRLAEHGSVPEDYLILEVSAELADRQRRYLRRFVPDLAGRVRWIEALPTGFRGAIVANEVADALPVERFRIRPDGTEQAFVVAAETPGRLAQEWRPASDALAAAVDRLGVDFLPGYVSELSLGIGAWVGELLDALDRGLLLLIDYGLPRRAYYAPDRDGGWLRCHFRHRVHTEPLIYPGIQDITAWVDFTAVAEAAREHGAGVGGFVTQAAFLLNGGLENAFAGIEPGSAEQFELARQVKLLTLPGEMGEHFKCMGLVKGGAAVPPALTAGDRSASL